MNKELIEGVQVILSIIGGLIVVGGALWLWLKRPTAKAKEIKELREKIEQHEHRIDMLTDKYHIGEKEREEMKEDMREILRWVMDLKIKN